MFDGRIRRYIDPTLDAMGRGLARRGIAADHVTLASFAAGICAAAAIVFGYFLTGFLLIAINRAGDGLDGAIARATSPTDRGAFIDIALDFVFYASIPVAFAVHDPARNGLASTILLAGFLANGAAFLAYAVMAERRGVRTTAQGRKSFYYLFGLAEGFETALTFMIACLAPTAYPILAGGFAALCFVSAVARIVSGWRTLS